MTLTDHDLSELLAAVKGGDMNDKIRTSLEWVLRRAPSSLRGVGTRRPGPSPRDARNDAAAMEPELLSLGISSKHSRPYHPQTCGESSASIRH